MAERILLVEDEEKLARMVEMELKYEGYEVEKALDGSRGLELALGGGFDLVLMDITMPNMDGLEALKAIRAADASANVVMCSAMGQETMVIDAIRSGAKDFIVKPFKPERVLKTVTSIVGEP